MINRKIALALPLVALTAAPALAGSVGYWSNNGDSKAAAKRVVESTGQTYKDMNDLSYDSLKGLDVLWMTNRKSKKQDQEMIAASNAIKQWVREGGVLVYNDRNVRDAGQVLPGSENMKFVRHRKGDVDIVDDSTVVTRGLDNDSLDHRKVGTVGWVKKGSAPKGTKVIMTSESKSHRATEMTYAFGKGKVHYSTIPLDYYLKNVKHGFHDKYAKNLMKYGKKLHEISPVPLPATGAALLAALGGLGLMRRRKKTA
ncbi:VPLPA-CTERM sorting domain-containing protein [Donghicola tyrosinivorans]|uniref:Putative secreted protein n=1 Tax=Donghicola tyrosinivorans TaxID=1652492 RepID=A0A2T0WY10_9RHOB|nr:VPLPA-CTERM sorting domain-containing protein [Donghicola tyrosinivorans]PRY91582.1 putative secreted protein [Donghicola tyrosinivorans]